MIDKNHLTEIVTEYKMSHLPVYWANESFKWKAIKQFQDNWDIEAADLPDMLTRSLAKTHSLLDYRNNFPKKMIIEFAGHDPEGVRAMFVSLFDEGKDLWERIDKFKADSLSMLQRFYKKGVQHYQDENVISVYLWLRYPDNYYIYKYREAKKVSEELGSNYSIKKGAYADNVRNHLKLYDEITAELKKDRELIELVDSMRTDDCYSDPELHTLTTDLGFYITRYYNQPDSKDDWWPAVEEYTPGFTKDDWLELLNNKEIIGPIWGNSLAEYYDIGGEATCSQIGKEYNRNPSSVSGNLTNLAKHIHKQTNCPLFNSGDGQDRYWPILFQGKNASSKEPGTWIWRLRGELYEALEEFDILRYLKKQGNDTDSYESSNYWWLNANPKMWSLANFPVGEVQSYTLYNDNGNKRKIYQNFLDAKKGDWVIGYESTPVKQVVAILRVAAEQDGENIAFEKVEGLSNPIDYQTLRDIPELDNMEYFRNPQGSLFKLTKSEFEYIMDLIIEENPRTSESKETYTKADFLSEVFMTESDYDDLAGIVRNKKNVILQGAPGVGKTFAAQRMAYSLMGEIDKDRVKQVQFHQNYSYEDFVMGYKPEDDGFELRYGVFYQFCQRAANHPNKDYYFIIDEINRGNLSKIFGELLMLIEKDHRDETLTMAYNGLPFSVPDNLYIIGMMNTADRSLALIDYALRRRFSFFEMEPGFDSEVFSEYQKGLNSEILDELILKIKELNKEITADNSLGKGFCIGHSYFCGQNECTDEWLKSVVEYDIIPMLSEYWFDDSNKLQRWENILRGVFQ